MNLHDEIAVVAYELFESRGCIHGCDLDDWLNAERIVLARHSGQEIEEPEEEDISEETAAAEGKKARIPEEGTEAGENEEPYYEGMS
jgi:hypothetical protein